MINELLTVNEVARLAGVHRAIIYRWVKLGKIPYCVIFKSPTSKRETIRFSRNTIIEQLENIKIREPAFNKRNYDLPKYVIEYITAMSNQHRDTPEEIKLFVEKYSSRQIA